MSASVAVPRFPDHACYQVQWVMLAQTWLQYWCLSCWATRTLNSTMQESVIGPVIAPSNAVCANCGRVFHPGLHWTETNAAKATG